MAESEDKEFWDEIEADSPALQSLEGKDNQIVSISKKANQLKQARAEMARLELEVKNQQAVLDQLEQREIPDLLIQLGLKSLKLVTGEVLSAKEDYKPSIPKDTEQETFEWLRAKGHGSLIKNEIKVVTGKGEQEIAEKVLKFLQDAGIPASAKESVHFQTLKALVTEMIRNGEVIDPTKISVFTSWKIALK